MLDRILQKVRYGGHAVNRGADAGGGGVVLLNYSHRAKEEEVLMNRRQLAFIVLLVSVIAFSPVAKADRSAEEAAEYFRAAVTREQWQRSMRAFRRPLGRVVSRKLKSKQYTNTLPGAPDGEYVVIQYETSFENKKSAIETIIPMLDEDGKWRVSGYYVK